ncbi:MAG: hypothetical protein R3D01_04425 [Hyphomicrobiales bacterium]
MAARLRYTKGYLGYSQRREGRRGSCSGASVEICLSAENCRKRLGGDQEKIELLNFALAGGAAAFGDNCAPCHGRGAQGAFGYQTCATTRGCGAFAGDHPANHHPRHQEQPTRRRTTRQMPAFGKLGMLKA